MITRGYLGPYPVCMRRVIAVTMLFLAACGVSDPTPTTVASAPSTTGPTTSTTAAPALGCPLDDEFASAGRIARITQPTSDSTTLGLISVQTSEGCERFGFDFETVENAPATTPPSVVAEFLDGGRIVRIHLDLGQTVITDQILETPLADRLFVVRSLDGTLFIDVHMERPASARVTVSNSPAGLTLELSSRQGDLGPAPAISPRTVLLSPTNDSLVDGPDVAVTGYARVFEGNVLILATDGGAVASRTTTEAADWAETWGEFEADLTLEPGTFELFVGEESPEDGSLQGVTLRLEVR
jgi:hypothetical protein